MVRLERGISKIYTVPTSGPRICKEDDGDSNYIMSTFKHHKTSADRSASDRRRHRKKIEKAIREGVYDIVAEESIIGQDGKKKIKIPVRGIKEYRFIFGDNQSNSKGGICKG